MTRFLNGKDDVRSAYWTTRQPSSTSKVWSWIGAVFDGDAEFRSIDSKWQYYRLSGTRWQNFQR
ncbi:hypothetical protein ACE103_29715 [Bradyrhizobium sp. ma5]|uniref:hypothetical protein n=1 Tax=Bradyrhizobium sp. ma5 TaxID=3344828 RepID=UPI0035D50CF0